ncbi:protein GL2-INTERACTING REPRESSOR 1-like [Corylus avellana]|uniref:protein GL2-INTERACTING REPRESSOR 1-like n=1 Tax=Corylus avellana TaxID=13451 RepID=UPI001E2135E4|nr:protein GL2-INTERACTING REPRESSOR 1-like [Corylus avellana]
MSRREDSPKLGLELNLSPPRVNTPVESPNVSTSSSSLDMSVEGSCVSSEPEESTVYSPRNLEAQSMMLVGCPRCLMYVMLSDVDPKCPKCKSTVLLDFLKEENTNTNKTRN